MKRNFSDFGLLLLRLSFSAMLLTHGYGKFLRLFEPDIKFMDFLGLGATVSLFLAVLGEFIAPILIMIGYKTRLVTLFPIVTMAVAAFIAHADDPFAKKEKALLFLFGFIAIALCGAGKYALDQRFKK
ncbi:DoxX family protein [Flavobacteriaceae bacterium]|nr:DoxX family protein [Flavobacteriaceae bacterium]